MEALCFTETSVTTYRTTRCQAKSRHSENLTFRTINRFVVTVLHKACGLYGACDAIPTLGGGRADWRAFVYTAMNFWAP
jgi:hypothetical protein